MAVIIKIQKTIIAMFAIEDPFAGPTIVTICERMASERAASRMALRDLDISQPFSNISSFDECHAA